MIDLCHLDEAGFAMTQPTTSSWFPRGKRLTVPFEANQGRRVNVIGALFTHGPNAGAFEWEARVALPKTRSKAPRTSPADRAPAHGVREEQVGAIDAECFLAFVWGIAGRGDAAPTADPSAGDFEWRRERPLVVVLDNYSVHTGEAVTAAKPQLEKADVHLCYLPSYCPELSDMEPVWQDVKAHRLPKRSHDRLGGLLQSVETALQDKATQLQAAYRSRHSLYIPT